MNIIEEIKARVKMTDVLSLYGVHPFRGTNIYKCIVHQPDKKPSANINKQNGKFHCFACGWTGDIFDIVKHFEGCDTKKAMQIVDERFGLSLCKELTPKEKRELKRKIKQRELEKIKQEQELNYENEIKKRILEKIRFWAMVEKSSHLTRGEYKSGDWKLADLYFKAKKEQSVLQFLFDIISGLYYRSEEYDYIYPADKKEILKMIREGEIEV